MLKIKPCSFCGELPNVYQINGEDYVECVNPNCPIGIDNGGEAFREESWNHRPIEDKLYQNLGKAKSEYEKLSRLSFELASNSMSFVDYIRNGDNKRAMTQMLVLESLCSDAMNGNRRLK